MARLSIPGVPEDLLSLRDFNVALIKDAGGISFFLDGDAFVLGATFTADAEFQLNTQGLFGGALLTANGGAFLPQLGLEFIGEFSLEINTTNQIQTITRTTLGVPLSETCVSAYVCRRFPKCFHAVCESLPARCARAKA